VWVREAVSPLPAAHLTWKHIIEAGWVFTMCGMELHNDAYIVEPSDRLCDLCCSTGIKYICSRFIHGVDI
jgi:hypothetical protein